MDGAHTAVIARALELADELERAIAELAHVDQALAEHHAAVCVITTS